MKQIFETVSNFIRWLWNERKHALIFLGLLLLADYAVLLLPIIKSAPNTTIWDNVSNAWKLYVSAISMVIYWAVFIELIHLCCNYRLHRKCNSLICYNKVLEEEKNSVEISVSQLNRSNDALRSDYSDAVYKQKVEARQAEVRIGKINTEYKSLQKSYDEMKKQVEILNKDNIELNDQLVFASKKNISLQRIVDKFEQKEAEVEEVEVENNKQNFDVI